VTIATISHLVAGSGSIPVVGLPIDLPRRFTVPPGEQTLIGDYRDGLATLRLLLRPLRPTVDFRLRNPSWYANLTHPDAAGATIMAERADRAVRRVLRAGGSPVACRRNPRMVP
jgi:hypothetical protein